MQKITILGLAVAISMISCIVSVAEAEPIPSPYQQVRDGTPMGAVVYAGDRMLMLSPSGAPACVFASSVDTLVSRGFVLVSEAVPDAFKTGDRPFVTTWRTASPNESITIPVESSTGAYTVDWGDGTVTSVTGTHRMPTLVPESTGSSYPATLQESISAAAPMRKSCNL